MEIASPITTEIASPITIEIASPITIEMEQFFFVLIYLECRLGCWSAESARGQNSLDNWRLLGSHEYRSPICGHVCVWEKRGERWSYLVHMVH